MRRLLIVALPLLILACSQEPKETTIQGSLRGFDNRPLAKAKVMLFKRRGRELLASAEVPPDGKFRLVTKENGILTLRFSGVHHLIQTANIFVDEPTTLAIDARLALPRYRETIEAITLRSKDSAPWNGLELFQQDDGTFMREFETEEEQLAYALDGILGQEQEGFRVSFSISGTQAEDYESNEHFVTRFYSVVTPEDGRVRIIFDPSDLPRSDQPPEIVISGESRRQSRIRGISERMGQWSAPIHDSVSQLTSEIEEERDPVVRQLLFLEYLEAMLPADADPVLVRKALEEISPESPYWQWRMPFSIGIATLLRQAFETANQLDEHQEYAFAVAESLPDVKSTTLLYLALWNRAAQQDLDSDFGDKIYDRLKQLAPDHSGTKWIKRQREFVGQVAPEFSVPSLEKPGAHYTNDDFRGKLYLIEFWATWCAPCVRDMPKLHQLYTQYQSQGFEILSYSLDSEEALRTFRREKWPMPWANSIEPEKGMNSEICKAYNVLVVPQPVLVGRDGKVLEIGEGFTADRLEEKLAQLLDQPKTLNSTAD